jgi:hypothetical protein
MEHEYMYTQREEKALEAWSGTLLEKRLSDGDVPPPPAVNFSRIRLYAGLRTS